MRAALTTRALLEGVGVGADAVAAVSAASATAQFVLRDVVGSLGAVLFAAARGSSFDAHAKQWRLFADCANDAARRWSRGADARRALRARRVPRDGVRGEPGPRGVRRRRRRDPRRADEALRSRAQRRGRRRERSVAGDGDERVWFRRRGLGRARHRGIALVPVVRVPALTAAHVLCNVRAVRCLRVDAANRARAGKMVDAWRAASPCPPRARWRLGRLCSRNRSRTTRSSSARRFRPSTKTRANAS